MYPHPFIDVRTMRRSVLLSARYIGELAQSWPSLATQIMNPRNSNDSKIITKICCTVVKTIHIAWGNIDKFRDTFFLIFEGSSVEHVKNISTQGADKQGYVPKITLRAFWTFTKRLYSNYLHINVRKINSMFVTFCGHCDVDSACSLSHPTAKFVETINTI